MPLLVKDYHNRINEYYRQAQSDYELIWHLKTHHCLHYGYWQPGTRTLREALMRMSDQVAIYGEIKPGDRAVDLGCGVGGPAVYLSQKYHCQVEGISISPFQIDQARELAKNKKTNSVSFSVQDYCHTRFDDEQFDIAYAIESACYAVDKKELLSEMNRILKPGGKLVVLDFFWTNAKRGSTDEAIMKKWTESWAIADYARETDFENQLAETGFINTRRVNINREIYPSVKRLYYCYYPGVVCDLLFRMVKNRSRVNYKNVRSAFYQYRTFRKGLWNYNIYAAEKGRPDI
ncbi:MAG: methyltransferase domain-containing protein [Chitinophagaceae bacterium]|nr:methyltransferase domain-containing protein [Chitinophagaceae bacterium]